ncbi:hypothetical protein MUK42_33002 [Musa troglodytarum]|uniref:Uncharacterized protein n=1 Tax=Musa troglodytarum TaxID=320322 RepID=A0A9E7L415_9LILI|nr:hypothetical protein MUK42_33002 [Musa troglodytarum]
MCCHFCLLPSLLRLSCHLFLSPILLFILCLHISFCSIVIMDGDPHPAALKGRMSFQSFNPSIDKLNEEAANNQQNRSGTSNNGGISKRMDEASAATESRTGSSKNVSDLDLKRKQPESETDKTTPQKLPKSASEVGGQSWVSNERKASHKQQKREKLDWNLLRPPKSGNRG